MIKKKEEMGVERYLTPLLIRVDKINDFYKVNLNHNFKHQNLCCLSCITFPNYSMLILHD